MRQTNLTLRVTEEQKQDWEEYIQETPEYDNLSQMIRTLVNTEVAKEDSREEELQSDLLHVLEEVESLESQLRRAMGILEDVQAEQATAVQVDDATAEVLSEVSDIPRSVERRLDFKEGENE